MEWVYKKQPAVRIAKNRKVNIQYFAMLSLLHQMNGTWKLCFSGHSHRIPFGVQESCRRCIRNPAKKPSATGAAKDGRNSMRARYSPAPRRKAQRKEWMKPRCPNSLFSRTDTGFRTLPAAEVGRSISGKSEPTEQAAANAACSAGVWKAIMPQAVPTRTPRAACCFPRISPP